MSFFKFSHCGVSYTLNGENVNVMLEFSLILLGSARLVSMTVGVNKICTLKMVYNVILMNG